MCSESVMLVTSHYPKHLHLSTRDPTTGSVSNRYTAHMQLKAPAGIRTHILQTPTHRGAKLAVTPIINIEEFLTYYILCFS